MNCNYLSTSHIQEYCKDSFGALGGHGKENYTDLSVLQVIGSSDLSHMQILMFGGHFAGPKWFVISLLI